MKEIKLTKDNSRHLYGQACYGSLYFYMAK